jgi:methyl-accepting chemotaxis protein
MEFSNQRLCAKQIGATVIVFLVFLIIPICIASMYYNAGLALKQQISSQLEDEEGIAVSAVQVKLNRLEGVASSLAELPSVTADAANGKWENAASAVRDAGNNVSFYDTYIDRAVFFDKNGIEQSAYPTLAGGIGADASKTDWYAAAAQTGNIAVSSVVKRAASPAFDIINIVAPIKNDGETVGFLTLQIPTRNFFDFSYALSTGIYGFTYIVDQKGNVVIHPKYSTTDVVNLAALQPVKEVLAGQSGTMITSDPSENQSNFLVYTPIPKYNWGIIIQEPYDEVFAAYNATMHTMTIAEAILFVIDLLLSYLVFRFVESRQKVASQTM